MIFLENSFLSLEEESFLFQYLFCGYFMEKTLKKRWYVTESRVYLILTNIVLLNVSSLIRVLLCKVRSLSRVAKIHLSVRALYWSMLKSNTNRSFPQIYLSLTSVRVYLCPHCGLRSVSIDMGVDGRMGPLLKYAILWSVPSVCKALFSSRPSTSYLSFLCFKE